MQRDYILRLIEQAGTILRVLLQRVMGRSVSRAELSSDLQRAAQLGGLDLELLRVCDGEGLLQVIAPTGEADPSRTWLAAETLYLDGLAGDLDGDHAAARISYVKAASLFRIMQPTWVLPTGFPEAAIRLKEIDERLAALNHGQDALQ
jgi:hypothetical protein